MKVNYTFFGYLFGSLLACSLPAGCTLDENDEIVHPQPGAGEQVYLLDESSKQDYRFAAPHTIEREGNPYVTLRRNNGTYELVMNTDCGDLDVCKDWNLCVHGAQSLGCEVKAEVSFRGKTQSFDVTPDIAKGPVTITVPLESDNPKEPLHLLVKAKVLAPPYVTIFNKTVPINYCYGPQLTYTLSFHYVASLIPKMYFKKNDISCLAGVGKGTSSPTEIVGPKVRGGLRPGLRTY